VATLCNIVYIENNKMPIIIIILLICKMVQLHNLLKLQKTLVTMCFYKHLCQKGLWFR